MTARLNFPLREVACVVLVILAGAAAGLWMGSSPPSGSTLLVAAIWVTLVVPLLLRAAQGRFDLFEPTVLFFLAYGTMFVARPAAMIAENDYSLFFVRGISALPYFDRMLTLALLGAICFVVGYLLPAGTRLANRLPTPPQQFDDNRTRAAALFFAAVGAAGFGLFVLQGGGTSFFGVALGGKSYELLEVAVRTPKYFYYVTFLIIGASLLLLALALRRRHKWTIVLAVLVFAEAILIRGSGGSRAALLPLFGGLLVFWYAHRGRRPRLASAILMVAGALVVSSAINYGRTPQAGTSTVMNYLNGFQKATSSLSAALNPILKSADASQAPHLAGAMSIVPSKVSYGYGSTLLKDVLSRPIPRQLWPGKPKPPQHQVTEKLAPRVGPVPYFLAYSVLIHPYLDWGMFGALLLAAYGIAFRALYEWYRLHERSEIAMATFAILLMGLVQAMRDGPVDALFNAVTIALPILVAWALSRTPKTVAGRTPRDAAGHLPASAQGAPRGA